MFDTSSISRHVGTATFQQGVQTLRNQQVLECEPVRSSSQEWGIEGLVGGSQSTPYAVSVTLEVSPEGEVIYFGARCNCPVGHNCKHSVALAFKAAYQMQAAHTRLAPVAPEAVDAVDTPQSLAKSARDLASHPGTSPHQHRGSGKDMVDLEAETEFIKPSLPRPAQWLDLFGVQDAGLKVIVESATPAVEASSSASDQIVYMLSPAHQGGHAVLQLGFGFSRRLKSGKWAKVRAPRSHSELEASPQDAEIVQLIQTLSARTYSYPYSENFGLISGVAGMRALERAAATSRLFSRAEDGSLGLPLNLGAAIALSWTWAPSQAERADKSSPGPFWALVPRLPDAAKGARCFTNEPPLYLHEGSGVCGPLEMPDVSADDLQLLLKAPPIAESTILSPYAARLCQLTGLPLPTAMQPAERLEGVKPVARLHIAPVASERRERLGLMRASLQFDYAGVQHYALHDINPVLIEQSQGIAGKSGFTRIQLQRDLPAEQAAHHALHALGLAGDSSGQFYLPFASSDEQNIWLRWLDNGFSVLRDAGFAVTQEPALAGWISRADDLQVEMRAAALKPLASASASASETPASAASSTSLDGGHSPWFDLSLGMSINGQRQNILPLLPELLTQLATVTHGDGRTANAATLQLPEHIYLKQDDGSFLRLPCEPLRPWLQALIDLMGERSGSRTSDFKSEALRLSRLEALRLGGALGEGVHWKGASQLRSMVKQLGGQAELPTVQAPAGLVAELRPYQLQGVQWLQFLRSNNLAGILADDMGLGKTLQTLAHVLIEKEAGRLDLPVLIIAPVSLMGNWRKEASRFTPGLRTLVLHGKDRHDAAFGIGRHDIVIAPYSLLQRDREVWQSQPWHLVVLDEAQNIKNANSHAAQVVSELNTRHRLCLSGTPMENHLGELWSLFNFVMPGFLGSQARFKLLYRTPIEKRGDGERAEQLRRRIKPFMLRRHKRDVAADLPEKQIAVSSVELGSAQADLYEAIRLSTESTVREALASKGLAKSQIQILDALLKLRQVCCDPRLLAPNMGVRSRQSAKLDLLMDLLPELLAEGRKVLLFSQFTSMLSLIEDELPRHGIKWAKLTGQSQKRDEIIERFTSGEVPLFLISLKAGGVGLNLTQADTVIHYDPWWNPAAENQATDRAHRIGQTQRVMVYKLVAQGTIEERILALQERKGALAESMYTEAGERSTGLFTEDDLEALLRPLGS